MPIHATDARVRVGRYHAGPSALTPTRSEPAPPRLRCTRPVHVGLLLLLITNAAQARSAPRTAAQAVTPQTSATTACTTFPPLSAPVVMHDLSKLLRSPFDLAREIYYRIEGDGCNPPESPTEEGILYAADTAVNLLESALLGPEATMVKDVVAGGFDLTADVIDDKPPSRSVLQNLVLSLVGLKTGRLEPPQVKPPPLAQLPPLEPRSTSIPIFGRAAQAITSRPALDTARVRIGAVNHEGVFPYFDTVSGREGRAVQLSGEYFRLHAFTSDGAVVEGVPLVLHDGRYRLRTEEPAEEGSQTNNEAPAVARVRCRRMPGAACSAPEPFSPELVQLLRTHHVRGLSEARARQLGIVQDQLRPGWFYRVNANRRRQYLRFEGRYFPVKLHRLGGCSRLTLHLPHRGPALVDIARSPAATGPRLITQAEYNVQFRGFASRDASHVYEHAIRAAPEVQLEQAERAAILRYYGDEETALDAFLQGDAQPAYRRQELGTLAAELDRALLRVPGYSGRVYRGALLSTEVLEDLEVGQMVRIAGFVRASGERAMGLHQLEGRDVPAGQTPVLLELQMRDGAHPVGLQALRDESEVIIRRGRVYKVVRNDNGVLELEEAGRARQAFGPGGAVNLRLG